MVHTGPFASALANRYGFRSLTIAGAIIASAAFCASSFAKNVEFLYITYGIIGGKILKKSPSTFLPRNLKIKS